MLRLSSPFVIVLFLSLGQSPLTVDTKSLSVQYLEGSSGPQLGSRNNVSTSFSGNDTEKDIKTFLSFDPNYAEIQDILNADSSNNGGMPKLEQDNEQPPFFFNSNADINTDGQTYYTYTTTTPTYYFWSWKLFYLIFILPIYTCFRWLCPRSNENYHHLQRDSDTSVKENSQESDGWTSQNDLMGGQRL